MTPDGRHTVTREVVPARSDIRAVWCEIRTVAEPDVQDRLLVEGLAPALRDAGGAAAQAFFLRERIGTTSRLRVWTYALAAEAAALAEVVRATAVSRGWAADVSLLPDVTLEAGPYGGRLGATFLAGMMADARQFLFEQLDAVVAGRVSRTTVALDIMTAHLQAIDLVQVFPGRYPQARMNAGFPATFPVYRSHADGLLVMSPDPVAARARLDAEYEKNGEAIRRRVVAVLGQCDGGPMVSEVARRWYEFARAYMHRADEALGREELTVSWDEGYIGDTHDLSSSPFHQIAQDAPGLRAFLWHDRGYLAARVMMSALYLLIGNLGVRLIDRFFLCHAICRACEELFDVDATAVLRDMARVLGQQPDAGAASR